jgi:hypothetical protein
MLTEDDNAILVDVDDNNVVILHTSIDDANAGGKVSLRCRDI